MIFNKNIIPCKAGGTLILVGIMFPVLLAAAGIALDMGRIYATKNEGQNALDAALLGAVANPGTPGPGQTTLQLITTETNNLFNANFPANYMGSNFPTAATGTAPTIVITNPSTGVYTASLSLQVPNMIMSIFNNPTTTVNLSSQATKNFQVQQLELTLVLDNTGSMACSVTDPNPATCAAVSSGSKMDTLKTAAEELISIIFTSAGTNNNISVSLVPFTTHVNLGPTLGSNWVQQAFQTNDTTYATLANSFGYGANNYLANRTTDTAADSAHSDYSDTPPMAGDADAFRTPYAFGYPWDTPYPNADDPYNPCGPTDANGNCTLAKIDTVYPDLEPISFALTDQNTIDNKFLAMVPDGATRIDVGLMWGWFTLSSKWQGVWDSTGVHPGSPSPLLNKVLILMTDGVNEAGYDGTNGKTNDDTETKNLCDTIKASSDNITIYTIGFGNDTNVNTSLLLYCATDANHYFLAPSNAQLTTAFQQIANDIVQNTLRLSQ